MTYVKICGITNLEDARCAAEAGADFLGFIFYPKSPRYIAPERAGEISRAIRCQRRAECTEQAPRFVGVFVDEPVDVARAIIKVAGLDLVQLHGTETPDDVTALSPYAFKALRPQTLAEAQKAYAEFLTADRRPPTTNHPPSTVYHLPSTPDLLVDAYHPQHKGGTGQIADLEIARWLAERCRLLLAGGLTPDNITDAIVRVRPWGVDVSSGVEATKGKKDHAKIRTFIVQVRTAITP